MEMGYANIGSLTQNNEFPNFMTEYSEIFNELVFVGICEKFIRTQTNETCSEELYNTGLETISIYILENSRKQLNIFAQGKDREDTAKKLIQSDEVAQLGKNLKKIKKINFFRHFLLFSNFRNPFKINF